MESQTEGPNLKEHKKLYQILVSKYTLHFLGPTIEIFYMIDNIEKDFCLVLSRKQTVSPLLVYLAGVIEHTWPKIEAPS